MTSAEPVLCRLELDAFGTPPRRLWLEARERPQGFSVWFWDEHLYPDGTELAASNSAYDARTFAGIILDAQLAAAVHDDPEKLFNVPDFAWRAVKVTGERGLEGGAARLRSHHRTTVYPLVHATVRHLVRGTPHAPRRARR